MENSKIRVLLVDDDAGYAMVAQHLLKPFQNRKFDLVWESNSDKVIEQLNSTPLFDVILMDYYLSNKTGLEIIKELYDRKNTIPIIFLTTNKDLRVAIEAMKYGVEEYLLKEDVRETILAKTIISVIDRVKLREQIKSVEKERILTEKKAEAIHQLVVTMCHEFNNPLAAIKISSDILLRQSTLEEDRKILEELSKNISLLEKQIVKLRDFNIGVEKSS